MNKLIIKIILINTIMPYSNLTSMFKAKNPIVKQLRWFSSNSENQEIYINAEKFGLLLSKSGFKDFKISAINRFDQRQKCAKKFCCYPKHIYDKIVFEQDPKAACLCTRNSPYDTKNYFLHADLKPKKYSSR